MVVVLTADPAFEQQVRATFGASAQIELRVVSGTLAERRGAVRRRRRDRRRSSISTPASRRDAGAGAADGAHRRLAAGGGGHAELRRRGGAQPAADAGRGFPGEAGAAGRAGAHLRARRASARRAGDRPRRRSTPSCRRSAAPASPRWRSRPRCCCSTAASAARPSTCLVDLDFQHGACADYLDLEPRLDLKRDRAAPGAARPAAARSDAVASCVRARGDRGAEPAGRDAHRSIPTW